CAAEKWELETSRTLMALDISVSCSQSRQLRVAAGSSLRSARRRAKEDVMKAKTVLRALLAVGLCFLPSAGAIGQEGSEGPSPRTYGTKDRVLYRIPAAEFSPQDSNTTYGDTFDGFTGFRRYSTGIAGGNFFAMPHLPAGALVDYVELDYCDSDPG